MLETSVPNYHIKEITELAFRKIGCIISSVEGLMLEVPALKILLWQ